MPTEQDQQSQLVTHQHRPALYLQHHLALALMVAAKWRNAQARFGATPTPAQLAAHDAFTEQELEAHHETASQMMRDYAASIAPPPIFWAAAILQSLAASIIYTLLLLLFALILKHNGVNMLSMAHAMLGKN